jgi:hypothetical protein
MGENQGSFQNHNLSATVCALSLGDQFQISLLRDASEKCWRDAMPLDDLSETLKDLAIKVYLVQLRLTEEQRVRELVKELKSLLDVGKATDPKPIL